MKKLIVILLIFLSSCEKCDSLRYQVHEKNDKGNGTCEYVMWAFTNCPAWETREIFKFTEVCSKYDLSQILSKDEVAKYR